MKLLRMFFVMASIVIVGLAGCGQATPASPDVGALGGTTQAGLETAAPVVANAAGAVTNQNGVTTPSGLQYIEISPGSGPAPAPGQIVAVHYTGRLADGTVFDDSYKRGEPIQFALGSGQVIQGWDEGIALMRKGGKARLVIPPDLAYGKTGAGNVIPPDATLTFDVELVDIREGAPAAPASLDESRYTTTPSGLKYADLQAGDGATAEAGKTVTVHYTGWLTDGTKFDSSLDRGDPFQFELGAQQVIKGWDEGVVGMQVGGKRQLVIPAGLGYGEQGAGRFIPPNATLVFEVELLDVQ